MGLAKRQRRPTVHTHTHTIDLKSDFDGFSLRVQVAIEFETLLTTTRTTQYKKELPKAQTFVCRFAKRKNTLSFNQWSERAAKIVNRNPIQKATQHLTGSRSTLIRAREEREEEEEEKEATHNLKNRWNENEKVQNGKLNLDCFI